MTAVNVSQGSFIRLMLTNTFLFLGCKEPAKKPVKPTKQAATRRQENIPTTRRDEYGYEAYLYRFQEFCREEYYRGLEESGSASFDKQLEGINKRLVLINRTFLRGGVK